MPRGPLRFLQHPGLVAWWRRRSAARERESSEEFPDLQRTGVDRRQDVHIWWLAMTSLDSASPPQQGVQPVSWSRGQPYQVWPAVPVCPCTCALCDPALQ